MQHLNFIPTLVRKISCNIYCRVDATSGALETCIEVLRPIKDITKSADFASVSITIPYICILTRTLERSTDDSGTCTTKTKLLHSFKSRLSGIEEKGYL